MRYGSDDATIPPYLTAAYSAKIKENKDSIDIIRAVAKEEMLHLALAANLLNAIGGQPDLVSPDFVPPYPTHLPTGQDDFDVGIEKFSDHALKIFSAIERPISVKPEHAEIVQYITKRVPISGRHIDKSVLKNENPLVPITKVGDDDYELHYKIALVPHNHLTAKRKEISEARRSLVPRVRAKSSAENRIELHYWSIGEFYKAIHLGFVELTHRMEMQRLFTGDPKRQVEKYYSGGGAAVVVTDLKSALVALDLITGQGEGSNNRIYDGEGELAHYYRFDQIQKKRYYRDPKKDGTGDAADHPQGGELQVDMDAVFPIKTNAKVADYHGHPELEEYALLFNGQYKRFLEILNTAFSGHPELLDKVLMAEMFRIKVAMERLIKNPIPGTDENAAPTFEMDQFKYPLAESTWAPASASVPPAPAPPLPDPFENFLLLSVQLCGISRFDLMGTGYATCYFGTVEDIVGRDLLHRLLEAFAALPAAPTRKALRTAILNHPEFGPIARNIIKLWYTATWFQLPPTWRENFGGPKDRTFVPYPYAYAESLLGPAVGAHPAGAKPTGHQSWTLPPVFLPIPPECE